MDYCLPQSSATAHIETFRMGNSELAQPNSSATIPVTASNAKEVLAPQLVQLLQQKRQMLDVEKLAKTMLQVLACVATLVGYTS